MFMHELNISDITCQNICLDQELLLQVEMGPHCILETLRRGAQLQKIALALTKLELVCNSNGMFFLEHACLSTHLIKAPFPLETLTWPKMAKLRESLKTLSLYFFDFAAPEQKQSVLSSYDANLSALENSTGLSFSYTDKTKKMTGSPGQTRPLM